MNAGAMIAKRQEQFIRIFAAVGAVSSSTAKTLEEVGCKRNALFTRLENNGVFKKVPGDRYYLDIAAAEAFHARRRKMILVIGAISAMVIFLLWWMR